MYQYDFKGKTQSENLKTNTPARAKRHTQKVMQTPIQPKSLFGLSFNHENNGEKASLSYLSRTAQLTPQSYSPLQMQLMPSEEQREFQPIPTKPSEKQEQLKPNSIKPNNTGIPLQMKERFENLSGFSFDDVKVHYNSDKPAQLQALAFTQGNQVYVGPGQEKHLGHELGHVVQQKQGKVQATIHLDDISINDNENMEREADAMGYKEDASAKRSSDLTLPCKLVQLMPNPLNFLNTNKPIGSTETALNELCKKCVIALEFVDGFLGKIRAVDIDAELTKLSKKEPDAATVLMDFVKYQEPIKKLSAFFFGPLIINFVEEPVEKGMKMFGYVQIDPSAMLKLNTAYNGINFFQFDTSISGGKLPVNPLLSFITLRMPNE